MGTENHRNQWNVCEYCQYGRRFSGRDYGRGSAGSKRYYDIEPNSTVNSAGDLDIRGIKTQSSDIEGSIGDKCVMSLEFRCPGEDSYTYLNAEFVREDEGWKISFYGQEK